MPAVARSAGFDSVLSPDGTGHKCKFPLETVTGTPGQERVSADDKFIVVKGGVVGVHPLPGCNTIDESTLSTYSSRVSAGGKFVGRIGDMYGNNVITSGSSRVFCG